MTMDTKVLPALGTGETYTDPSFLLVQTSTNREGESHTVIDRLLVAERENDAGSWMCKTITLRNKMTHEAAVEIAKAYAEENLVPVVYQQHDDQRNAENAGWTEQLDACNG